MGERRSPHMPLDDAIDRAVRGMMSVDPAPGFEGRVMQRLERPAPTPVGWPRLTAAVAVGAMLIVLATLLGTKSTAPVVAPQDVPVLTTEATPQPPHRVPTMTPNPRSTTRSAGSERRQRRRDVERRIAAASANEPPIPTVPALEGPHALAVSGIDQKAVSVPAIAISTLEVAQLNVQPLQTLEERRQE